MKIKLTKKQLNKIYLDQFTMVGKDSGLVGVPTKETRVLPFGVYGSVQAMQAFQNVALQLGFTNIEDRLLAEITDNCLFFSNEFDSDGKVTLFLGKNFRYSNIELSEAYNLDTPEKLITALELLIEASQTWTYCVPQTQTSIYVKGGRVEIALFANRLEENGYLQIDPFSEIAEFLLVNPQRKTWCYSTFASSPFRIYDISHPEYASEALKACGIFVL